MNKENNQNEQNNNDGSMDTLAVIVTLLMCMCQLLNSTKLEKFPYTDNTHREH